MVDAGAASPCMARRHQRGAPKRELRRSVMRSIRCVLAGGVVLALMLVSSLATAAAGPGPTAISSGGDATCAIRSDDTLACWGDNYYGQVISPQGTFSQVSAGTAHACALKSDNTLACWGDNFFGEAT